MSEDKLDKLFQLGVLMELLGKSKELIQMHCLLGGHRGYSDDMLNDMINEAYDEIEKIKEEFQ